MVATYTEINKRIKVQGVTQEHDYVYKVWMFKNNFYRRSVTLPDLEHKIKISIEIF